MPERLRICQVSTVLPPAHDGVADGVMKFHRLFRSHGIESWILTSFDQAAADFVMPVVRHWSLRSALAMRRAFKTAGIRKVLMHYPSARFRRNLTVSLFPLLYRCLGIETSLYIHEYYVYSALGKARILPMAFFSRNIIASDERSGKALKSIPFLRSKLTVLTVGSNFEPEPEANIRLRAPGRRVAPAGGKRRDLLFFGFLREGKGLGPLLDAVENSAYVKERFHIHIVGAQPETMSAGDRMLFDRVRHSSSVTYHGYMDRPELDRFLETVDLMVLPFEEGVTERRGSFMIGMAWALPVVTTKPAVLIQGLRDPFNVIFMEGIAPEHIEAALCRVSQLDDGQLLQIGRNAKEWYDSRYSEDIFFEKLSPILFGEGRSPLQDRKT